MPKAADHDHRRERGRHQLHPPRQRPLDPLARASRRNDPRPDGCGCRGAGGRSSPASECFIASRGTIDRPRPPPTSSRNRTDRDVVAAASLVRRVHERPTGVSRGSKRRTRISLHLVLADHPRQPVAAQQQHVAGVDAVGVEVDVDVGFGAERARDDRALRVLGGLLLGQLAAAHELLDERVVAREPRQLAVAQQVGTAVADVRERQLVAVEVGGGERRAHPVERAVLLRDLVDALVRLAHARLEPLLGGAVVRQAGGERLGREARGDLAGLRAAHPVGDDEQRRAHEEAVLVRSPLAAGVGLLEVLGDAQHAEVNPEGRSTRSPRCGCGRRGAAAADRRAAPR